MRDSSKDQLTNSGNLTPEERAEIASLRAERLDEMSDADFRRYVELRRKERGDGDNI